MPTSSVARMPWTLAAVAGWCAALAIAAAPVAAKKATKKAAKKPAAAALPPGASVFRVEVDKSHALDEHWMGIRMSRPPGKVQLTVKTEEGAIVADVQEDFTGKPAGVPLVVRWDQAKDQPTGSISLRMYDRDEHYIDQEYSAWYVPIPHEEVNFRMDASEIDPPEVPKLDAAFGKIEEVLAKDKAREHKNLTLYIAGHTDTVGNNAYNLQLSQRRAQSLARWFRGRGVRIPIAYEGFGETVLRVQTPDNTDEVRNRRADYIIADEAPPMTGTTVKPAWRRVN